MFNQRIELKSNLNKLQTFIVDIVDRETEEDTKICRGNVFCRIKWSSVSLDSLSKCWKRQPPDDSDVEDVKQGLRWRSELYKYILVLHQKSSFVYISKLSTSTIC